MESKKWLLTTILFLTVLTLSACQSVSKEKAIEITQDFVNNNVKFYVNDDNDSAVVQNRASIDILNVLKVDDDWHILLNVRSKSPEDPKQANLLFIVDGKSGDIKSWGKAKD